MLAEARRTQPKQNNCEYRKREHITPDGVEACSFKQDRSDGAAIVAKRIEQGKPLKYWWHTFERRNCAGQLDDWKVDEKRRQKSLPLVLTDCGKKYAYRDSDDDVEQGDRKEDEKISSKWNVKEESAQKQTDGNIYEQKQ